MKPVSFSFMVTRLTLLAASAGLFAAIVVGGPAAADVQAGKDALKAKQYDKAFKELRPEAEKGNADALYILATMHSAGWGTPKDIKRAHELFGKAAELGHVPAQKEYGVALILSDGIEQNVNEGLKWLLIASQNGDRGAAVYFKQLSKSFPRTVISTARHSAFEWRQAQKAKKPE